MGGKAANRTITVRKHDIDEVLYAGLVGTVMWAIMILFGVRVCLNANYSLKKDDKVLQEEQFRLWRDAHRSKLKPDVQDRLGKLLDQIILHCRDNKTQLTFSGFLVDQAFFDKIIMAKLTMVFSLAAIWAETFVLSGASG